MHSTRVSGCSSSGPRQDLIPSITKQRRKTQWKRSPGEQPVFVLIPSERQIASDSPSPSSRFVLHPPFQSTLRLRVWPSICAAICLFPCFSACFPAFSVCLGPICTSNLASSTSSAAIPSRYLPNAAVCIPLICSSGNFLFAALHLALPTERRWPCWTRVRVSMAALSVRQSVVCRWILAGGHPLLLHVSRRLRVCREREPKRREGLEILQFAEKLQRKRRTRSASGCIRLQTKRLPHRAARTAAGAVALRRIFRNLFCIFLVSVR